MYTGLPFFLFSNPATPASTLMSSVSWRRPPQASSSAPVAQTQSKSTILVSHRQVLGRDYWHHGTSIFPPSYPSSMANFESLFILVPQRGNPLLKHIRNARWAFADVVPDYVLCQSSCALYLRFFSFSASRCVFSSTLETLNWTI